MVPGGDPEPPAIGPCAAGPSSIRTVATVPGARPDDRARSNPGDRDGGEVGARAGSGDPDDADDPGGVLRRLRGHLEEARSLGYLGPGPIEPHVEHALGMGRAIGRWDGLALDLGSGAGLPGLVLAVAYPWSRWVLLDAHGGRTHLLEQVVDELGLADRVRVLRLRAEEAGRRPELREACALVTARAFGPPAVVAEVGAALIVVGGRLVVSEPPDPPPERWPAAALSQLGLRRSAPLAEAGATVIALDKVTPSPDWVPRRTGLPAKRPLF